MKFLRYFLIFLLLARHINSYCDDDDEDDDDDDDDDGDDGDDGGDDGDDGGDDGDDDRINLRKANSTKIRRKRSSCSYSATYIFVDFGGACDSTACTIIGWIIVVIIILSILACCCIAHKKRCRRRKKKRTVITISNVQVAQAEQRPVSNSIPSYDPPKYEDICCPENVICCPENVVIENNKKC
uniref:Uncharacterized protein n=1 Tax=Acrobeloides nanus TaxID=290746 RepID=A0A914C7X6_9BILA